MIKHPLFILSILFISCTTSKINVPEPNMLMANKVQFDAETKEIWAYDFKGKGFTYTQLRFNRDLNSWRLNFSWVPFSDRSSWNFFIGIKSGLLSDIKYEKQSLPNRTY